MAREAVGVAMRKSIRPLDCDIQILCLVQWKKMVFV